MRYVLRQHAGDLQLTLPALPLDLLVIAPCRCCGRSRAWWMSRRGVAVARVAVGSA